MLSVFLLILFPYGESECGVLSVFLLILFPYGEGVQTGLFFSADFCPKNTYNVLIYIVTNIPSLTGREETVRLSHSYQHFVPNGTIFSPPLPVPLGTECW
jgi:hypothetical protein